MKKRLVATFLVLIVSTIFCAGQNHSHGTTGRPRLVVGIVIEQMRVDYIDKYWNTFPTEGGFKKLATQGSLCINAHVDIHNIKATTGCATLSTGTYPSAHGIVGDRWYKQLSREFVTAVGDDYCLTLGSDSKEGNCSALNLKTPTLGDMMRLSTNLKSKVFSVAMNSATAVLMGGHIANGAYWLDKTNGNMISSSYYCDKFPLWVQEFNKKAFPDSYLERDWYTLMIPSNYDCGFEDGYILEKGFFSRWNTFPYELKKLRERTDYPYELLKATPWGNKLIRDFAVHVIENEELGKDDIPDLLNIAFSSLDFANRWFGPGSVEMHDLYLRLDEDIASIIDYLDENIGPNEYVIYLTSPSTSDYCTSVMKDEFHLPAGEFSPQSAMALLRAYLNAIYGNGEWIVGYNEEQVYLDHYIIEKEEKQLSDMQEKTALFLGQFEGVENSVSASVVETGKVSNSRFDIVDKSYCVKRSGDVILQLENWWYPSYKYHSVDYTIDNRVPLIFYGKNIKKGTITDNISLIDIVPTLGTLLGISPYEKVSGKIIDKAIDQ